MLSFLSSEYVMLGAGLNDILDPLKDNWITPAILFILAIVVVKMVLSKEAGDGKGFQSILMFLLIAVVGLAVYFSPGLIGKISNNVGTSVEQGFDGS